MKKVLISICIFFVFFLGLLGVQAQYKLFHKDVADKVYSKLEKKYENRSEVEKMVIYGVLVKKLDKLALTISDPDVKKVVIILKAKLNGDDIDITFVNDDNNSNNNTDSNGNNNSNTNSDSGIIYTGYDKNKYQGLGTLSRRCSKNGKKYFYLKYSKKCNNGTYLICENGKFEGMDGDFKLYDSKLDCIKGNGVMSYGECREENKERYYRTGRGNECFRAEFECQPDNQTYIPSRVQLDYEGKRFYKTRSECVKGNISKGEIFMHRSNNNNNTSPEKTYGNCSRDGKKFYKSGSNTGCYSVNLSCKNGKYIMGLNFGPTIIKGKTLYNTEKECIDDLNKSVDPVDAFKPTKPAKSYGSCRSDIKRWHFWKGTKQCRPLGFVCRDGKLYPGQSALYLPIKIDETTFYGSKEACYQANGNCSDISAYKKHGVLTVESGTGELYGCAYIKDNGSCTSDKFRKLHSTRESEYGRWTVSGGKASYTCGSKCTTTFPNGMYLYFKNSPSCDYVLKKFYN